MAQAGFRTHVKKGETQEKNHANSVGPRKDEEERKRERQEVTPWRETAADCFGVKHAIVLWLNIHGKPPARQAPRAALIFLSARLVFCVP
jgi:uncharacterized MAPEG superfamily protein